MPILKLQQIKRPNDNDVHFVNIPKNIIKFLGWRKGEELDILVLENSIKVFKINGVKNE